ncbi:hypothetical protein Alg130_11405, partial [Pyrenophora tritici-repentis]
MVKVQCLLRASAVDGHPPTYTVRGLTRYHLWWDTLTNQDVTIFSDGSEQRTDGERFVTYGYAIYQAQTQIAIGRGSLNPQSHVFDAEA